MENNRIKISSIVESQLPLFVREEYPLVSELLTEYYRSLESKGSSYDILQNIDQYVKINNLTNLVESTQSTSEVGFADTTISVISTDGFPKAYGIIQINNEIILYKSKTATTFDDCIRGFSGISEYSSGNSENLIFNSTEIQEHPSDSEIINLSSLFLKEFFNKVKKQFAYGFDDRELFPGVNKNLFVKQTKDFYTSKGTDRSFEILFRVLYGKDVEVILPRKYLIEPSNAQYRVTRNYVVESIQGNIEELVNRTVFQDQYGDIPKSFGTVTDTQKILRNGKEYYTLMLDYDFDKDITVSGSIFGELKIHPKTVVSDNVQILSDNILVDSTIGFPDSGELVVNGEFSSLVVTYNGKTINQFLNCNGISESISSGTDIALNTYAYGYDTNGNEIRFRITGVIQGVDLPIENKYYERGDTAKLLTLGYNKDYLQDNNWIFNTTVKCEVKQFNLYENVGNTYSYEIETYDENGIYSGDLVEIDYLTDSETQPRRTEILQAFFETGSVPGKKFLIKNLTFKIENIFYVKRIISRYSDKYASDVLNVYRDFETEDLYVTSSSLPSYDFEDGTTQTVEDYNINFSGTFFGTILDLGVKHGFITGDSVIYSYENSDNTLGIQSGVYFIKKEDETRIKLARSRSDIRFEKFVSIGSTTVANNRISLTKFAKKDNVQSEIDSQRLVKLLRSPQNTGEVYETTHGTTGILINGVEILNYKSDDYLYYGAIKKIDVISPGNNYDIINPPELDIHPTSTGLSSALGHCGIEGSLHKINLIDGGFDYLDTPIISITGGNGQGATAVAEMSEYVHFVNFNSTASNSRIDLAANVIGFSTYHKFRDGESVVYYNGNNTSIGGLVSTATYFVKVVDGYSITLHNKLSDSLVGINTVDITSYGVGNHKLESTIRKKKISSISVTDSGFGYKSKKISSSPIGIDTGNNTVNVYEHPYNSGDIIYYYGSDGENISGLDTGKYIATRVSDTSFRLSAIGIGTTSLDFYYKTKQYIDFKSTGSGYHTFDYEPIVVNISGKVGVSTLSEFDATAKIQPIFRGKVTSAFVYEGGVGYGSSEIINYNKQPEYTLKNGYGAVLSPVISNGKLVDVVINERGKEYNSPPDLIIRGFGVGASAIPIIQNGEIIDVKIVNSGIGYEQKNTTIDILVPGSGCELKFIPQTWTINKLERLRRTSKLSSNDGVVFVGRNKNYGLQYTHLYPPRPLRNKIFTKDSGDGQIKYRSDLQNDFEEEKYHSPLLGWAYDGNPIYGPYGYDSPTNKKVKQIKSGYSESDSQTNRPDKKEFPIGYFVEDYTFLNLGDLDEHNGRFCVTPEFPNGTYAYFMTLEDNLEKTDGFFLGYKKPKFPYIIGNTYKSKPVSFNFESTINQNNFNFQDLNILRNTKPYNTLNKNSSYEYFKFSGDLSSRIETTTQGSVNSVKIISGGDNYKVGDRVIFDNENSGGTGAVAEVQFIDGKEIIGISQTSIIISDVEFYQFLNKNQILGISTIPHKFSNNDLIFIDPLSTYDDQLYGQFNVIVSPTTFNLNSDVADISVTGIVTYFYISGPLNYPSIIENDILVIGSEKVKVLNIEKNTSRIRVLREQDSTVGVSHSTSELLYEDPRKFYLTPKNYIQNQNYRLSREIYFDPSESLGIGTISGIGHTVVFSNPGVGLTSIIIQEKTIYLKDHGLKTGDKILYKTNGGIGITVTDNINGNFTLIDNSILYTAKISNDYIGISTVKVGIGSTGGFVGISQTASTLYFVSPGSGNYHSFSTLLDGNLKKNVVKNSVTVSTASTNYLKIGDLVSLEVISGLTTTINVKYSDYHKKLLINPRNFSSVDTIENLITIKNHNYLNGQKLIHTSSSPAIGLEDQEIYYAIVYDKDRIKLAKTYYAATNYDHIIISSSSFGTLSPINPQIKITKNQKVIIDLSDPSLSQQLGIGRTSSFDFDIFADENFSSTYFPVSSNGTSKILKSGVIGVSPNARVEFTVDSDFPQTVWYNLVPNTSIFTKSEYKVDDEVLGNNKITFVDSKLSGQKTIVGVTSNTFSFQNEFEYDSNSYSTSNSQFSYYTNSTRANGKINKAKIVSAGTNYARLPSISSITSSTGSGAILLPQSDTIGKINSFEITDIGYDYSIDYTIRPRVKFPTILRVEPLSNIESIQVISFGSNYNTPPDLVVIDGVTKKVVNDVILYYDIENKIVEIIKNTTGLYGTEPKIVPINNSNGLKISSLVYDNLTKKVKVYIKTQFSDPDELPISIGDNILVENVSVIESTGKGYNSEKYDYSLFPVVGVQTSLGGSGSYIEYSLENYILDSETPGTFDSINSSGQIIAEKLLPTFKTTLAKNYYIIDETISANDGKEGKVLKFDPKNEFLTIETKNDFSVDSLIIGKSSGAQSIIKEIFGSESFYRVDSSSIVINGWNRETGFLNNDLQRIHDSDYYQYFSYALKSEVPFSEWNDVVSNLNHTLGFKKFSDLVVISSSETSGIQTSQIDGTFTSRCDLNNTVDVDCVHDYDLVSENSFYVDGKLTSNEIIFNSTILQDYSESVGNRVLLIDDISDEFNTSITRTFVTSFSI